MTFEEFVEHLYKIGWRAVGDAQHTQILELWGLLIERGLVVHKGGLTKRAVDGACTCDPSVAQSYYVDGVEKCAECRRPRR